jgi:LytS/YehU family sensor histidine kinase
VTAALSEDLRIVVRNTGAPLGSRRVAGSGVGLENVSRRLHHYYGKDASLTVSRGEDGATVAELRLPTADVYEQRVHTVVRNAAP